MKKQYINVVVALIVVISIGALFFITRHPRKEDVFSKKQECSTYYELANTKIRESGRVFQKDTYTLDELFYSPKMDTCLYAYTIHTTFDPKEIYSIYDLFGAEVYGSSSLGGNSVGATSYFQKRVELKK